MAAGLFSMTSSRQHEFELHSPALCEELRIRDILDNVAVMTSGAFVAAYELSGVHSYYHTEDMRNRAKESLEAVLRSMPDRKVRDAARRKRNAAQLTLQAEKDRTNDELKALMMLVRKWADEKKENRRGWCKALHIVVCGGRSKGSLLWNTFPQEAIDMIAEETGSQPVQVAAPDLVDGEIEFDHEGRVFLVEHLKGENGENEVRRTLLLQIKENGDVFREGRRVSRVHPFPLNDGRGEIRDGHVVFEGIPQRPTLNLHRPT